jgi:hypothetical protein
LWQRNNTNTGCSIFIEKEIILKRLILFLILVLAGTAQAGDYWLKNADANQGRIIPEDMSLLSPGTEDFTYSFWMNSPLAAASQQLFVLINPPNGEIYSEIMVYLTDADNYPIAGLASFVLIYGPSTAIITGITDINDGRNHLITIVCDRDSATGQKLYIDGGLEGEANAMPFAAATFPADCFEFLEGPESQYGDDFRFYKGAVLTQSQIQDIYNSGIGCKINETEISVIVDDGWFSNVDDNNGTTLSARKLVSGVWSDDTATLGSAPFAYEWVEGGVPFETQEPDAAKTAYFMRIIE